MKLYLSILNFAIFAAMISSPVAAIGAENPFPALVAFVHALNQPLLDLGDQIDRQRLILYLRKFGTTLQQVANDKSVIAGDLKETPIPRKELSQLADRIQINI